MRMRFAAIAAPCLLAGLAGCTQTTKTFDETVAANLPKACAAAAQLHAAFAVVAATGRLGDSLVRKEAQAVAALQEVCADPAAVSSSNALIIAANAFSAWAAAGVR